MDIYLYHFNNYYNRRLKLYPAVEDYEDYEVYRVYSVNFNPNDGVITEHVIGADSPYNGTADYAIIIEDNQIISRWFIIENQRIRGGQHRLVLKRDTVADFAAQVLAAPCFVEKGWVPDSDSAIFNSENMTYNQIKKDEILLKDSTRVPWLVGYYTKSNKALTVSIPQIDREADITVNGIENWTYYDLTSNPKSSIASVGLDLYFKGLGKGGIYYYSVQYKSITSTTVSNPTSNKEEISVDQSIIPINGHYSIKTKYLSGESRVDPETLKKLTEKIKENSKTIYNFWDDYFPSYITNTEFNTLQDIIGSTIFDSTSGKTYKVNGTVSLKFAPRTSDTLKKVQLTSSLGYELHDIYSGIEDITGNNPTSNSTKLDFLISVNTEVSVQFELEELNFGAVSASINPVAAGQTLNSPFNIFAIPFGELRVIDGEANVYTSETLAMRTAMALIEQYSGTSSGTSPGTSGVLHDLQLLPYCPIQEIRDNVEGYQNPRLKLADIPGYLYSKMTSGENTVGYIFNCPSTSAKFSINRYINIKDYKIENETEFCRLVSPNWNGTYEFSPAKNRGLEYINVDLELKPFSPYIHLAPQFNESGLYGLRDGDPIGLICGGDFGLTMISDAWAAYERQNKNYQNIFDRQIQNLEVQHKYARIQDIVGATVGTAQGASSGAILGSMIGGGVGAGIGAGVGGIASALGGVADYQINEQLRSETMDYTKDLFGYQLGNIKALPDSLTKVNSFNPNNTIFPILEFYGCTPEETEALKNKIKYNGMSIGRIGALKDFINPSEETYIKGQLILLDIEEDSHIVNDISAEIYKGVRV